MSLMSQGGLYNENAGAAPPRVGGAVACAPGCLPDPRSAFPTEEAYQAWLEAEWISGNILFTVFSLGRWWLARTVVSGVGQAVIGNLDDIARMSLETKGFAPVRQLVINDKVWNSLSKASQWAVNQKWLDIVIRAREEVILATRNFAKDSFTAREVEYLLSNGYRWASGGAKLVPK